MFSVSFIGNVSTLLQAIEKWLISMLPMRLAARLRAAGAENKAIIHAAFWLTVFVLAAKGVAALKEIVVAFRYGTSEAYEGYLLVFNLLNWPVSVLFSVMTFVLVPTLVRQRQAGLEHSVRWQRQFTAWVWLAALGVTALCVVILPWLIARGTLGLTPVAQTAALNTLPLMSLMVGLGMVASWHACQLMSSQRHVNTLLESMPALAILVAVLVWPAGNVSPLLWGTLAGFAMQALLMAWAARLAGSPVAPTWPQGLSFDRELSRNSTWLLAAQLLMGLAGVADQIILAHLPAGSLATYGYAYRVMALVLTLSATVLGRALLPVLAGVADDALRHQLARRWATRVFWVGLAATAVLLVSAEALVAVLFERGAFTAQDREATALLLRLLALQLPLYLVGIVWIQWTLIQPNHGQLLWWAAVAGTAAKLILMFGLIVVADWGADAVALGEVARVSAYWIALRRLAIRSGERAPA